MILIATEIRPFASIYPSPDFYQNFLGNFQNLKKFSKMISKGQESQEIHMVPPMIFLELLNYWKNHMVPPMTFDKTIQQYNIFVWYNLKNIQINFSKFLYIPPLKFSKIRFKEGGI